MKPCRDIEPISNQRIKELNPLTIPDNLQRSTINGISICTGKGVASYRRSTVGVAHKRRRADHPVANPNRSADNAVVATVAALLAQLPSPIASLAHLTQSVSGYVDQSHLDAGDGFQG